VLAFADRRTDGDDRVNVGYAMVFPVAMIVKIIAAQVLART
jgi:putative transport protein